MVCRPRRRAGNPAVSAALASSLAIPSDLLLLGAAASGTHGPLSRDGAAHQRHSHSQPDPPASRTSTASNLPPGSSPQGAGGTKHDFFAAFSRASTAGAALSLVAQQQQFDQQQHASVSSAAKAGARAGPSPNPPLSRLTAIPTNLQSAQQRAATSAARRSGGAGSPPGAGARAGTHQQQPQQQAESSSSGGAGPLQAAGPPLVPKGKARVVFDPDRLEQAPGAPPNTQVRQVMGGCVRPAGNSVVAARSKARDSPAAHLLSLPRLPAQGKAPSWFQGPYRSAEPQPLPHGSWIPPFPAGQARQDGSHDSHRHASASPRPVANSGQQQQVETLKAQHNAVQVATRRAATHVEQEMAAWASRRARLEEEIVRRQEASRYAMPLTRCLPGSSSTAPSSPPQLPPSSSLPAASALMAPGELSAYAGVTRETHASLAAGILEVASAPDALRLVPGLAPAPTTADVAHAERSAAAGSFEREAWRIATRVQELGLVGAVRPQAMIRALAPVPDRPYLECIARLPRPGEHLQQVRPGSSAAHHGRKGGKHASKAGSGDGTSGGKRRPRSK